MYGLGGLEQVEVVKRRRKAKWLEEEKKEEEEEEEKEKTKDRSVPDGSDKNNFERTKAAVPWSHLKKFLVGSSTYFQYWNWWIDLWPVSSKKHSTEAAQWPRP